VFAMMKSHFLTSFSLDSEFLELRGDSVLFHGESSGEAERQSLRGFKIHDGDVLSLVK